MISTLTFIFSGAIFLYALLLVWTKDINLIRRHYAVKMKNKKVYATQFAKVLALTAIALALMGLLGFITENGLYLVGVFIVSFVVCIRIGIKFIEGTYK